MNFAGPDNRPGYQSYLPALLGEGGDVYHDDNAVVGLTQLDQHQVTGGRQFLDRAGKIFTVVGRAWDGNSTKTCPGGMGWFDSSNNSIRATNVTALFAQLAAELYEQTRDQMYLDSAKQWASPASPYSTTPSSSTRIRGRAARARRGQVRGQRTGPPDHLRDGAPRERAVGVPAAAHLPQPRLFEDAEERVGDRLETYQGDWSDWWVDGVGAGAVSLAATRRGQAALTEAQTVASYAHLLGVPGSATVTKAAPPVYRAVSLFNEHTWGAGDPWTHGECGHRSGETQWH